MSIIEIFEGSNGEATSALYRQLEALGPKGVVALNLFRACKASSRAKVYRGGIRGQGSFKSMAYDRKAWSIQNLCVELNKHSHELGITWGWKEDPASTHFPWVLYVDLPTGQCSFHSPQRGGGPDYPGQWDGKHMSAQHIVSHVRQLIES